MVVFVAYHEPCRLLLWMWISVIRTCCYEMHHARVYFQQLVDAISYMHRNGVAHRDLKLENIMITADDKMKVCDFGLSVEFNEDDWLWKMIGCGKSLFTGMPLYMAPEIFSGPYEANKTDVWAMGVILYLMCSGRFPFDDTRPDVVKKKITDSEPEYPENFSPELTKLLQDLLKKEPPEERPAMEEMAEYPWLMSWERCLGDEPAEWTNETVRKVDEPAPGMLTPLTVFQLVGTVRPLRFEHAVWDEYVNLRPVSFVWNLSEAGARKAIREWVENSYGDNASLEERPQSIELTVETDESGNWSFTITTCELSGLHNTVITLELHAGNPAYMEALEASLVEYLQEHRN